MGNVRRLNGVTFDPLTLSPHAGYKFRDRSTLYQDSAKTIPVTATGQPIGAAVDQSGHGRDVLQATTAYKPIYTSGEVNGNAAAVFDGVDDWLKASGFTIPQPSEIWMLFEQKSQVTGDYILGYATFDASNLSFIAQAALTNAIVLNAGTSIPAYPNHDCGAGYSVLRAEFNGASSALTTNGGTPEVGNAGTGGINGCAICTRHAVGAAANIGLVELWYMPQLSAADAVSMTSYLMGVAGL